MDNITDEEPYLPFVDNTEDDDVDNVTDEDEEPSDNSEDYYQKCMNISSTEKM